MTSVGLSVGLIDRLKKAFPGQVAGVKDSSGDWANSQALLEHHADLHILIGDERLLAKAMNLGASGTICGLANIAPDLMQAPVAGIEEPRIAEIIAENRRSITRRIRIGSGRSHCTLPDGRMTRVERSS